MAIACTLQRRVVALEGAAILPVFDVDPGTSDLHINLQSRSCLFLVWQAPNGSVKVVLWL